MSDTVTTVRQLLDDATAVLATSGMPAPRRSALRLWSDLTPGGGLVERTQPVAELDAARYLGAATRLAAGEPWAYVTGWTGFRHLKLACDARALIPRPETEGLVELALARTRTGRAADVGTGAGGIALSLRGEGAFTDVVGIDISAPALELAIENGLATGLDVAWRLGDMAGTLDQPVDLLVANPPYLTVAEHAALDASVRDYEPALALPSGVDGMEMTRRLLDEGKQAVVPGGWIALELDSRRAPAVASMAAEYGWTEIEVRDDLFGRSRYMLGRREAMDD